jgi:hypothetical protein
MKRLALARWERGMADFLQGVADFLMDCLIAGMLFFLIACLYAFIQPDQFGVGMGIGMSILLLIVVLPMIVDVFLHTTFSTILPWGKAPTLIGVLFIMPGMGLLFGIMRSW